jgi:hypothetical protein
VDLPPLWCIGRIGARECCAAPDPDSKSPLDCRRAARLDLPGELQVREHDTILHIAHDLHCRFATGPQPFGRAAIAHGDLEEFVGADERESVARFDVAVGAVK